MMSYNLDISKKQYWLLPKNNRPHKISTIFLIVLTIAKKSSKLEKVIIPDRNHPSTVQPFSSAKCKTSH